MSPFGLRTPLRYLIRVTIGSVTSHSPFRHAVHSLFALPQRGGPRWEIATRAALSISVPLGVLTLLGHQDIGLQTAAGAFTALYAGQANTRERAKILPFVILVLMLCAAAGVLLAPSV